MRCRRGDGSAEGTFHQIRCFFSATADDFGSKFLMSGGGRVLHAALFKFLSRPTRTRVIPSNFLFHNHIFREIKNIYLYLIDLDLVGKYTIS